MRGTDGDRDTMAALMMWLVAIAVCAGQKPADSYARFVDRLLHANSISGTEITTVISPDRTRTGSDCRYQLKRPNLCHVEIRDESGNLSELMVGDGKVNWIWEPALKRLNTGTSLGFYFHNQFLDPFEEGKSPTWVETPEAPTPVVVDGRHALRFHLKRLHAVGTMELDMDPGTDLPLRDTVDRPDFKTKFVTVYKNFKIDPDIDPVLFTFKSDVEPNTWDALAYMLDPGTKAPDFAGKLVGGHKPFRLSAALKGRQALLLDLVMPGCVPCWDEIRGDLAKLRKQYSSKGLEVVAVGLGSEPEVMNFLKDPNVKVPVVIGETCEPDLLQPYRVSISTAKYLIDSKGVVRAKYLDLDIATLKRDLARLGIRD